MMLSRLGKLYIAIEYFVTNALLIGVVFFVFTAAVMRWAGYPLAWSVEFGTLLFVWVIFLGANRALRENRHIGVDFFTKRMPDKVRFFVELCTMVVMIAFLLFIFYYGVLLCIENSARLISNLPVSYSWVTAAVPTGSLLMTITLLVKFKQTVKLLLGKG